MIILNPTGTSSKKKIERTNTNLELKQLQLVNQYYSDSDMKSVKYPNGFIPAMNKLGFGIFFILCLVTFGGKYPMDWILSEEFKSISFFDKLLYIQIASFCARFKFYIVWLLAEGACILSGLGFNGYDEHGHATWNRVTNVDIVGYETADNIKSLLEAWNMNTNKWLKNYVYLRVTPHGKKPTFFSTFATFGASAIWHGFYPGYYLTFITGAFVQSIHRTIRRNVRPIFLTPKFSSLKPLYNLLAWSFTQTMIHYIIIPFNVLSLRNSLHGWKSLYFCGHIVIILLNVAFWSGLNKVCDQIVQIGGGIDVDEGLKKKKEQGKIRKTEKKGLGEEKVDVTETGMPLEADIDLVDLKKEE